MSTEPEHRLAYDLRSIRPLIGELASAVTEIELIRGDHPVMPLPDHVGAALLELSERLKRLVARESI